MDIERARKFIYQNARPLDFARWQYLFEGGSRDAVLRVLEAYQNEDGGFGHGLEADCWNPDSSPIQTWAATEIIKEVGLSDSSHPLIQGILRYLGSGTNFDSHVWYNSIPSNNDYPHAPWWNWDSSHELTYNPTACLIGFILKFSEPDSALYDTAVQLAHEAYANFKENFPLESMHTASCFVELYEYLKECGQWAGIASAEFEELVKKQISYVLTADTSVWSTEYVCKPSLFITSRESLFYLDNREICELECEFISKTQEEDGTWAITWDWGSYPEQWNISKNWWKSDLIIKNIKFYNAIKNEHPC